MKKKKKKAKNKNTKVSVVIVIMIIITVYVVFMAARIARHPNDTVLIEYGKISMEEITEGIIIRNETVLSEEYIKSGMEAIELDGTKVSKGQKIFRYTNNEEAVELQSKIVDVNKRINEVLKSENTIYLNDIKELEKRLELGIEDVNYFNSTEKITEFKRSVGEILDSKAKFIRNLNDVSENLKNLIDERNLYTDRLNLSTEYSYSPLSGIISYRVDGLEDVYTQVDFSNLSMDSFSGEIKTGEIVQVNTAEAKIIDNFECYVAVISDSDKAKTVEVRRCVNTKIK